MTETLGSNDSVLSGADRSVTVEVAAAVENLAILRTSTTSQSDEQPVTGGSFSWHVLSALTDDVRTFAGGSDSNSVHVVGISLTARVEGHPHVHGANLGIRADVYEAIGGWSPLRTGEDAERVARAESSKTVRILRTGQVPVWTSSRPVGRAPAGFADYLSALPGSGGVTEAEGA